MENIPNDWYKAWIDDRHNDLIWLMPLKLNPTTEESIAIADTLFGYAETVMKTGPNLNFNIIVDLREITEDMSVFPDENVKKFLNISKQHQVKKLAVIGKTNFHMKIVRILSKLLLTKVAWFSHEPEALAYLGY